MVDDRDKEPEDKYYRRHDQEAKLRILYRNLYDHLICNHLKMSKSLLACVIERWVYPVVHCLPT